MSASSVTAAADWSGGKSPFNVSYGKLMMWLFLLSDAFTFSGFLIAYGLVRFSAKSWPVPEQVFDALPFLHGFHAPLVFVGIMTFILIVSSVTMVLAVDAGHRMDKKGVQKWMFWTIIGGITFLNCQAFEWTHFIMGTGGEEQTWRGMNMGRLHLLHSSSLLLVFMARTCLVGWF